MDNAAVRTEILGFQLALDGCQLMLSSAGNEFITPVSLSADDAERLRLEMAKAQLWEWNQLETAKRRAELRYRRYFGSWLVMCLAAFSAYLGYPSFYLCLFLRGAFDFSLVESWIRGATGRSYGAIDEKRIPAELGLSSQPTGRTVRY